MGRSHLCGHSYFPSLLFLLFSFFAVSLRSPEARLAGQKPGLTGGSSEIQKIEKKKNSQNSKKFAYLAKPWKKFAYLTEFGPKPPVPGSKEKAGWPDTWADWGKPGNSRNPKIPNPKTGRSWARPILQNP